MASIQEKYDAGMDLDDIWASAEVLETSNDSFDFDIFKGDKLDSLQGIPFVVMGGTFRETIDPQGKLTDFVTLMCVIGGEKQLEARRYRYTGDEPWWPAQTFGINDGSTGIRRQMVAYLHNKGIIQACEEGSVPKEDGARGECTWDTIVSEWHYADPEMSQRIRKAHKKTGAELTSWEFKLENGLVIPRGIRSSSYVGPFRKEITTRYFAS